VLTLPASVRIYVAAEPTDLRRGLDGLAAATRSLVLDPLSGHIFCYLNRRKNRIKLYCTYRLTCSSMDVAYRLSGINLVWDRKKAGLNLRRHGVTFETACEIFSIPL